MNIELLLVNPRTTSSVNQILKRSKWFIQMCTYPSIKRHYVFMFPPNGKGFMIYRGYENKAQCRNVWKKFSEMCGIEWREITIKEKKKVGGKCQSI